LKCIDDDWIHRSWIGRIHHGSGAASRLTKKSSRLGRSHRRQLNGCATNIRQCRANDSAAASHIRAKMIPKNENFNKTGGIAPVSQPAGNTFLLLIMKLFNKFNIHLCCSIVGGCVGVHLGSMGLTPWAGSLNKRA
jgi:hypothetical protein